MKERFFSRFSPGSMSHETLEAVFVQRHKLAEQLVKRIRASVLGKSKHYQLLIGPRGIGKTHLMALVYHRIKAMSDLQDKLCIAYLREEEWGIASLLDLLLRIFAALLQEYPNSELAERVEGLYELPFDVAERAARSLLKDYIGERTLFVLIENLDELFKGLGDEGQKRFRAYLQEHPFCTILATSRSLFAGVSLQTSPFYGFFRIHHLEGLTVEEARQLLIELARWDQDTELSGFLQTAGGLYRVRAIHHLAGGNHRVYVVLYQFLSHETLDELSTPFLEMLDDLTPYYQSRMALLSPQQRKIIEFLVERRHAVPVKEIARRCFITHQTASSQLKQLVELGHLRVTRIGRESFYELREPLFRLCLEVKDRRGPIKLFVDFLRLWCSREELEAQLHGSELSETRMYLHEALELPQTDDAQFQGLLDALKAAKSAGDNEATLHASEQLAQQRGHTLDWYQYGHYLGISGDYDMALEIFRRMITSETNDAIASFNYGLALGRLDKHSVTTSASQQTVELDGDDVIRLSNSGMILMLQGHHEAAVKVFEQAVELASNWAWAWYNYGCALHYIGHYGAGLKVLQQAVELDANLTIAWRVYGELLCHFERYEEALGALQKANNLGYQSGGHWWIQGILFAHLGRGIEADNAFNYALKLYTARIEKVPNDWSAHIRRCFVLLDANRLQEGKDALKQLFSHIAEMDATQQQPFRAGLIRCLSDLISCPPPIFLERAQRWLSVLREVAGDREEFSVALRLLDTAVRYRETGDERVLLQLPLEERQLLEPLLKESPLNAKLRL